jgi:hypothetical protein
MSRHRILFVVSSICLIAAIAILFAPFFVANGFRWWLKWQAHRQGLTVQIEKIDAPFLRPLSIQRLHITNADRASVRLDISVERLVVDLNLTGTITRSRGRFIHLLSAESARAEVRRDFSNKAIASRLDWVTVQRLLPASFNIRHFESRVESGDTVLIVRGGSISGNDIESGRFIADEFIIDSPWFRQTFSNLRGATRWQENRLTIGGITLSRGLDLQLMTSDLSHLGAQHADLQFDLDAFGGKIRASIAHDWQSDRPSWNVAGVATGISLAQTTEAIGFTDRLGGSVRACNFTFRGDPRDPTQATASIWAEINGLSWHNRGADVLMIGAAVYNRQIQLQQFYVKQRNNQFIMSGEGSLPSTAADWLRPDFRGDISGSIADLGQFAALFGAQPGDFAGTIAINGTMNARDRKIGGHLDAAGNSLSIFKTHIDRLVAKLSLTPTELDLEQLEITRKKDFVRAQGKVALSHEHNYSGKLDLAIANVNDYLSIFRGPTETKPISTQAQIAIESGAWKTRVSLNLAGSSPVTLDAQFPFKLGQDWNAFMNSPLEVTVDFPMVLLANAPKFFHPEMFSDGVLSGKLSLNQTLQHPQIGGEVQLLNAKLQNAPLDLVQAAARLNFSGDHATIDSLNVSTKDVDVALSGAIDFKDTNDVSVKIWSGAPIFDLTPAPALSSCVQRIELQAAGLTLAPAITELAFRGNLSSGDWKMNLQESTLTSPLPLFDRTTRPLSFCADNQTAGQTLTLGTESRTASTAVKSRKRPKRR